jgi:serine/threonine-protein kinase
MTEAEPLSRSRYQVITTLGQGGMARVLLTMMRGPAGVTKLLVVKELKDELKGDPEFVTMFLDEARIAARLNHPNVIQTYEVGSDGDNPLIVMEYLEGQSLSGVLGRVGRKNVPLDLHLYALAQTAAGLHYAHELRNFDGSSLGLVHRDVSPHNVFVTYDGRVLLVDFGIAKAADSAGLTRAGVFKGKLGYAAPEQLRSGGVAIDRRADIFALGVMLWEALAQRRLTTGESEPAVMHRRATGGDLKIADVAPTAHPELCRICDKAMAHDPAERFQTAAELRAALEAHLETSKRVGGEEIGKLVRETFAADREKVRALVEAQMKTLKGHATTGEHAAVTAAPEPAPVSKRELSEPRDSTLQVSAASASSASQKREEPGRGRLPLLAVGAAVALLVGLWATRGGAPAHGPEAAPSARPAAPPEPAPVATVEVWISADPPEARLALDDAALTTNPFHGVMARSALTRRLRVSAPGYATDERLITLDRDVRLELSLKSAPSAAPSGTAAPAAVAPRNAGAPPPPPPTSKAAAPGPAPGEVLAPQPQKKGSRPIDDTF